MGNYRSCVTYLVGRSFTYLLGCAFSYGCYWRLVSWWDCFMGFPTLVGAACNLGWDAAAQTANSVRVSSIAWYALLKHDHISGVPILDFTRGMDDECNTKWSYYFACIDYDGWPSNLCGS